MPGIIPAEIGLPIVQGSKLDYQWFLVDEDDETTSLLSAGDVITCQIRRAVADNDTGDPLIDLTSTDGGIEINVTTGEIKLNGTATQTRLVPIPDNKRGHFWDLKWLKNGEASPVTLATGRCPVIAEVTRSA